MNTLLMIIIIIGSILVTCFFGFYTFNNPASKKINIGETAPSFILPDETEKPRSLAEFKGKKIVLYFYPKDETPGCTKEACGLRDSFDEFNQNNIVILGVSYDSPESHKNFKEKEKLPFILLADTNHAVAHKYGTDQHVMGNLYPLRKTFLINEQGVVTHIFNDVTPETHAHDILNAFGL
jgi:thioredoxin-dependent peroxiredoxin